MPISFSSKSHGPIPVGFFNIETDMLIMDRYFLFASDFCSWVMEWADTVEIDRDEKMVYTIQKADRIGNLAGAIHGFEFTGFIGEVYKKYPFPENRTGFKQKPDGSQNRQVIEGVIQQFATQLKIGIIFSQADETIRFGDYVFEKAVFQKILSYVQAGGMPGWLMGRPPDYVKQMTAGTAVSEHWLFT